MKKLLAGAGAVALAALPVAGVFAADLSVMDTLQITVNDSCTITEGSTTDGLDNKDTTYAATVANGAETTFNGTASGSHVFHVSCNKPGGWSFSATPTNLTGHVAANDSALNGDSINFVASGSYGTPVTAKEAAGKWTATITAPAGISVNQPSTAGSANLIIEATNAQAANVEITSAYKAYVGTETSAGFYEGTITYVLAALQ